MVVKVRREVRGSLAELRTGTVNPAAYLDEHPVPPGAIRAAAHRLARKTT